MSLKQVHTIRNARPEEFPEVGRLMVQVYSQLEGFPKPDEQPAQGQIAYPLRFSGTILSQLTPK